uniref:protein-serine/threonine phosphatase n=1 Tax=Romanomermis culicivorax TaxID=13658 RepID=A0A915K3L4_ROMCU
MVRVKPYKFFRHTGDINAPPGFEKRDDEPPENDLISKTKKARLSSYHEEMDDDYLLHLRDILSRLHAEWYKLYDQMKQGLSNQYPNTHQVVPYVRAQTLSGVRLTFSGLVPTQSQTLSHPLYELARRFGAQVSLDVVGEASQGRPAWPTTHLVANRQGTAKIREAQNWPRIEIVNRNWFFLSTERWIKQPEDAHRILDDQPGPSPPANWQMANGHLMKNVESFFLNAIFPHGDHMALIIDDRDDVWDFAQNMVRGSTPTETKKARLSSYHEEMDDDYLLHLRDILSRLHAEWYKLYDQMKQGLSNQYPNTHQCKIFNFF